MAEITHSQKTAKSFIRLIRGAKPGRRSAFAVGRMGGTVPIVFVARGKPASAEAKLKITKFEAGKEPKGAAGGKAVPATSGLLFLESGSLVLQCRRRPPGSMARDMRQYFAKLFRVPPPWRKVVVRRLGEDDEGDGDQPFADQIPDDDAAVEAADAPAAEDDEIEDEWDAAPTAAAASPAVVPAPEPAPEAAAKPDADALARLVGQARDTAKRLGIESDKPDVELEASFASLLQRVPLERLMLALAASPTADAVRDADEIDADPITNDAAGIATVADALLAMGLNLARKRGVLAPDETGDRGRIETMVRTQWGSAPTMPAGELVTTMITLLGRTFQAADDKRLRGLLGLAGAPAARPPAEASSAQALAAWRTAREAAIAELQALSHAIAASGDPEAAGAAAEIAGVVTKLPPTFDDSASADAVLRFVEAEPIILDAEGINGFGLALSIRTPLMSALAAVKAAAPRQRAA